MITKKSYSSFRSKSKRVRNSREEYCSLEDRRLLATFTVNTPVDFDDGDLGNGATTLREAVNAANQNADADRIVFDEAVFAASPRIELSASLSITSNLSIEGSENFDIVLDAGNGADGVFGNADGDRIFLIPGQADSEIQVSFADLTLSGGDTSGSGGAILNAESLTLENVNLLSNYSAIQGGGLANVGNAKVEISGGQINGNTAVIAGGGLYNTGNAAATVEDVLIEQNGSARGAGVFIDSDASVNITGGDISSNAASDQGGGLFSRGESSLQNVTLEFNVADENGGGIQTLGSLGIFNSRIVSNRSSAVGGGIANEGNIILENVVLRSNTALDAGGGIFNASGAEVTARDVAVTSGSTLLGPGGGIFNSAGGVLSLHSSSISSNDAQSGGGVDNRGQASITETRFFGNASDSINTNGGGVRNSGSLKISESEFLQNQSYLSGGGIANIGGVLQFDNNLVRNNVARRGGGLSNDGSPLTIEDSEFISNTAGDGGGVYHVTSQQNADQNMLRVTGSTFERNVADPDEISGNVLTGTGFGGGIFSAGQVRVEFSSLNINSARPDETGRGGVGGAIYIDPEGDLDIRNSTIFANDAQFGGGVGLSTDTNTTIYGSTFSGNFATVSGGGLYSLAGTTGIVVSSTFYENASGSNSDGINLSDSSFEFYNSILGDEGYVNFSLSAGFFLPLTGNFNLVNSSALPVVGVGNISRADGDQPLVQPLRDNGGLKINFSTLSGNSTFLPSGAGGAAVIASGSLEIFDSTIVNNSTEGGLDLDPSFGRGQAAGLLVSPDVDLAVIRRTVIANNLSGLEQVPSDLLALPNTISGDNNLIKDTHSAGGLSNGIDGNIVGIDPLLSPLENFGGPTLTHVPLAGSPLITVLPGDIDINGVVNFSDISPFIAVLSSGIFQAEADLDGNGVVNFSDISPFVAASGSDPSNSLPQFDQRGENFPRALFGKADIGAVEYTGIPTQIPASGLLVSTTFDVMDNDYSVGNLSLREAIFLANVNTGPQTIEFSLPASGQQTILLNSSLPTITEAVNIIGPGADLLVIDAGHGLDGLPNTGDGYRVIKVASDLAGELQAVHISGVTLSGGDVSETSGLADVDGGGVLNEENLSLVDIVVANNSTTSIGGGIANRFGNLLVQNSIVASNNAIEGGGVQNGGVASGSAGEIQVVDSTIENNVVTRDVNNFNLTSEDGGGISNHGTLSVIGSVVRNNQAVDSIGGGLANQLGGRAEVRESTFSGNSADFGGGINNSGTAAVFDSTVDNNFSEFNGGGFNSDFGFVSIINSTFSSNSTGTLGRGGGLANTLATELFVISSTFTENIAGASGAGGGGLYVSSDQDHERLLSSIVANNFQGTQPSDILGVIGRLGLYNLIGDADTAGSLIDGSRSNIVGVNANLGPLALNGGPTRTHALLSGSPAIDSGINVSISNSLAARVPNTTDQRGAVRSATSSDIGSFERYDVDLVADIVDVSPDPRTDTVGIVTINFSEDVTRFVIADLSLTRDGSSIDINELVVAQISPSQYTVDLSDFTVSDGDYELRLNSARSGIVGSSGNVIADEVFDEFTVDDFQDALLGDVNLDGVVSFLDISPFISLLSAGDFLEEADVNQDGRVDFLDINPFITTLAFS